MPKFINMVGKTFGHITVLAMGERIKTGGWFWQCRCGACGNSFKARGGDLRRGDYISCGCVGRARSAERARCFKLAHGQHGTPLYMKWKQMNHRCVHDKDYLRQGVTICERWKDFELFASDMGPTWKPGLSLERKNNLKGYELDNCCWIPLREQARNRMNCPRVVYQGTEMFLWRAAELLGMRRQTLWQRYRRGVRPPELFNPLNPIIKEHV